MSSTRLTTVTAIRIALSAVFFVLPVIFLGQGVVITEESSEIIHPHESAIFEVRSDGKGILIPSLSTLQRELIKSPANGLLVYDTDENSFFYYDNMAMDGKGGWIKGSSSWFDKDDFIFIDKKVAIGLDELPAGSLGIGPVAGANQTDPLFEVKNDQGEIVFAVYPDRVEVIIDENEGKTRGGFAVSGRTTVKGETRELFVVSPDKTRVYIDDSGAKTRGGFAVSGRTTVKDNQDIFLVTSDSTRVYLSNNSKTRGGFAVSGRTTVKSEGDEEKSEDIFDHSEGTDQDPITGFSNVNQGSTKGLTNDILFVDFDRTHVFIDESNSKTRGGFAVSGRTSVKGEAAFMQLTPENYFIGHESGDAITDGLYNSFLGYNSGKNTNSGSSNVFLGYQSGMSNTSGNRNIFVGHLAGKNNTIGSENIYIGYQAGLNATSAGQSVIIGNYAGMNLQFGGGQSLMIGDHAGKNNTTGSRNTFVGFFSGRDNVTGDYNAFFGQFAGQENTGDNNTYIGYWAGGWNTEGEKNTFVGVRSGLGASSPYSSTNNLYLGYEAGAYNTGSNNVMLGFEAGRLTGAISNRLYIANSQTNTLIYGEFDNNRVGVNTTFPSATLDINGTIRIRGGSPDEDRVLTSSANGTGAWKALSSLPGSSRWTESGANIYRSSGNVGIGTSSPAAPLDINASDEYIRLETTNNDAWISLRESSEWGGWIGYKSNQGVWIGAGTNEGRDVRISGNSAGFGSGAAGLTVSGNNRVGIGATSPSATLHVEAASSATVPHILIKDSNTGGFGRLAFQNSSGNKYWTIAGILNNTIDASSKLNFWYYNGSSGFNALTITGQGRVGIGTTSPSYALHVTTSENISIYGLSNYSAGWAYGVYGRADGTNTNVGVRGYSHNTNASTNYGVYGSASGATTNWAGYFSGNVYASGNYSSSDITLKRNISPLSGSLGKILSIQGVNYEWKSKSELNISKGEDDVELYNFPDGKQIGVIAQDLEEVLPEAVLTDGEGKKYVNYNKMIPLLIEAIKEQQQIINEQGNQMDEVRAQNQKLQQQVDEIMNMLGETTD